MTTNQPPVSAPDVGQANPVSPAQAVRRRRSHKAGSSVLEQAVALRDQLRGTLTTTKEIVRLLKAEKRSQKSLQLALDSLKQLQAAA